MADGFTANTAWLAQCGADMRDQIRTAQRLEEKLQEAAMLADPSALGSYQVLMDQAATLTRYFTEMSELLCGMSEDLERLSLAVGRDLEESISRSREYAAEIMRIG